MDVKLVVQQGQTEKRVVHLRGEETVVGRRQDCGLRIPSAEVSRRHCVLRIQNGCVNVEDLDSANGTYLNGKRIKRPQVVRPGDRLEIGPVRFVVEYQLSPEAREYLDQGATVVAEPEEDLVEAELLPEDEVQEVQEVDEVEEVEEVEEIVEGLAGEAASDSSSEDAVVSELETQLDDGERLQLPEPDQLRDLLSQMDDSQPAPGRKKR